MVSFIAVAIGTSFAILQPKILLAIEIVWMTFPLGTILDFATEGATGSPKQRDEEYRWRAGVLARISELFLLSNY